MTITGLDLMPETDGGQALAFLERWFGDAHPDWLVQVARAEAGRSQFTAVTAPLGDVLGAVRSEGVDALVYAGSRNMNVYVATGFLNKVPESHRRGGRDNVRGNPGVWLDLDVKPGSFRDEAHCLEMVTALPLRPSVLVATGSGGVHAYYRTPQVLPPDRCQVLGTRLWTLAQRVSGVAVDKLSNADRIMRLPGTVRWPKGDERPAPVRLLLVDGPDVTESEIEQATERTWTEYMERRQRAASEVSRSHINAAILAESLTGTAYLYALSGIEDDFNTQYSWDQVLLPHGWTYTETDHDGRRVWARPNAQRDDRRAATTDWPESPDVMSLFSDSEETGLRRLRDAGIPITKYRAWVELAWRGDETGFVRSYFEQIRQQRNEMGNE